LSDYDLFTTYEPEQPATLEEERPPAPSRPQGPGCTIYSVITAVFLLATVGFIIWAVMVVMNPVADYNPFPPRRSHRDTLHPGGRHHVCDVRPAVLDSLADDNGRTHGDSAGHAY
jgi:hypothetical protein